MREKCRSEPYGEGLTPTIVTVRRGSGSSVESLQMELQAFSDVTSGVQCLLRGSVRGRARRVKSQICDDAMQKPQSAGNSRRSLNTLLTNVSSSGATTGAMDELKQQGIQAAESLASDSVVAGHCASAEETTFDDSEEWAKIEDIVVSFGGIRFKEHDLRHSLIEDRGNHAVLWCRYCQGICVRAGL
ncbi:uncharacterized protein LOC106875648 isoform X3 [Octopus bimaculoides]|uniref:uncharacterized protein LOC106875648 isoform X3 n=1 Tax=Octopus bimaculoides TaxID=37653 RepID=UPI00071CDBD0|nr:uncharacterized protein LOC106875648 isoform X3 [Octopus bimaculoides]|eukprot:XP_014779373.1 PREDICTED: uncharacterized protein LOC106875648 isoform X2 [Octopus bimaculoides]